MKKHYMAPKAEIVQLTLEGMVATSKSMQIDDSSYVGNQQLSALTEKRNQERRYHAETQEAGRRKRFNFLKTFVKSSCYFPRLVFCGLHSRNRYTTSQPVRQRK